MASFRDAADEQVGDEAGVEGPRAKSDEVGAGDGLKSLGHCRRTGWFQHDLDNALTAGADFGLATDKRTVLHAGNQDGIRGGGGEDAAPNRQDFAGKFDGLGKVAGHLGQSGDKEVAEAVAAEFSFRAKTMAA